MNIIFLSPFPNDGNYLHSTLILTGISNLDMT